MRNLFLVISLTSYLSACQTKTALDITSCIEKGIADAAAPLLGEVSSILLGSTTADQAQESVLSIGIKYGAPVVLCALDTVIRDLGGSSSSGKATARPSTARPTHAMPDVATKAIGYGVQARASLLLSLSTPAKK